MDIGFKGATTTEAWYQRHCANQTKVKVVVGSKAYTGHLLAYYPVEKKLVLSSWGQPVELETRFIRSIVALPLGVGAR